MAFWRVREELSQENRMRRSYYELLRDDLDHYLLQYALLDSYQNFIAQKVPYPYVKRRELKPRARIPAQEYNCQSTFLLIFCEDVIPDVHKKSIRFFDVNKTVKANLLHPGILPLSTTKNIAHKYLDSARFFNFLETLLPVDYALLIQRAPASKNKNRYGLTHFHVRIDWPIAEAAEDLAIGLRYISKDLYERGDKYAEDIQKKFFEYYAVPFMVGGRRTAAIVAAQYMKRMGCIATVYVASSESRALIRISERGASKAILMRFFNKELEQIAAKHQMSFPEFRDNYVVAKDKRKNVCIFQTTYAFTNQARPPDDGKLRDIKPDLNWLTVGGEHLLPKPGVRKYQPIPLNVIYT